jgi:hypothetical protein
MSVSKLSNRCSIGLVVSIATLLVAGNNVANGYDGAMGAYYGGYGSMGYGGYHSSTVAEGYLRGRAAVIDAAGIYEVNDARAAILNQHARSLSRGNDLKQTEALYAQQKMWSDARIEARNDRELQSQQGQHLLAMHRATTYRDAYRLSDRELNVKTGAISWPEALQGAKFSANRDRVEELFRQHVGYGAPQAKTAQEIARSVDQWSRSLRNDIATMRPEEYLAAQKFLIGLKYSAASLVETT